jgi:hypothetical protein
VIGSPDIVVTAAAAAAVADVFAVGTSNGCLFLFDRCDPSPCFLAAEKILFAPALSLFPSI